MTMMMEGMMAPGHLYNPATKTGLLLNFDPEAEAVTTATERSQKNQPHLQLQAHSQGQNQGQVQLWQAGKLLATAKPGTTTVWDYYYNLRFVEDFPQVTHWYFGSAWTGKVRLSRPIGTFETVSAVGLMQFIDEEVPALPWMLTDATPVLIHTPMPPFEVRSENLPLRFALAELVLALIKGDIQADDWQLVTSLVERKRLAEMFPTTMTGQPWQLETLQTSNTVDLSLREVLCRVQGHVQPQP